MKGTLLFFFGGILAWLIVALVFALLVSCAGCYDPITPGQRPHGPRPNPYGLPTNTPSAYTRTPL